jgi:hypothetical protein
LSKVLPFLVDRLFDKNPRLWFCVRYRRRTKAGTGREREQVDETQKIGGGPRTSVRPVCNISFPESINSKTTMATGSSIPDDVRRFILTSIPSVPYLEALLLLRADPRQQWDCGQLARRLYLSEKNAAQLLAALHEAQVLGMSADAEANFHYHPATPELDAMIQRVGQAYSGHLVEITNLIHSATGKKAQHFADAFKWRKDT